MHNIAEAFNAWVFDFASREAARSVRISRDPVRQNRYLEMLSNGVCPKMAEMLAMQQFAGVQIEGYAFMSGRDNNQDLGRMNKVMRDHRLDEARRAGVSVHGKIYVDGLADYPSDPFGWVVDETELKAKCKSKGLDCSGAVTFRS